jgi:hypothetical protein
MIGVTALFFAADYRHSSGGKLLSRWYEELVLSYLAVFLALAWNGLWRFRIGGGWLAIAGALLGYIAAIVAYILYFLITAPQLTAKLSTQFSAGHIGILLLAPIVTLPWLFGLGTGVLMWVLEVAWARWRAST